MTNKQRAAIAQQTLQHFRSLVPSDDDVETLSVDLIADICHLLNAEGIDPNDVFKRALDFFDEEHFREGRDHLRNNYGV